MLINCIKQTNLYENTKVIRLGIVNDDGIIINDEILKDPIFDIIYVGKSLEYERPTLLHMRKKSEEEENTNYFYLHTKGISHFGNKNEQPVIDWINLMLYWNIEHWKLAVEKLKIYDTYGCNYCGTGKKHYSGNFWWSKNNYIRKLSNKIGPLYNDPENWILTFPKNNKYTVYNSGHQGKGKGFGHYAHPFPREEYVNIDPL